jgi:hypothetical protein
MTSAPSALAAHSSTAPTASRRTGLVLTGAAAAFLLLDGVLHLVRPHAVLQAFTDLGYPAGLSRPFGLLELVCVGLYLFRRTAPLGAVLLTGYLGGAVSAHARLQDPLLSTTLFPVYLGAAVWAGLWLRDRRVHALIAPVR